MKSNKQTEKLKEQGQKIEVESSYSSESVQTGDKSEVEKLKEQPAEPEDRYLRIAAEFENYKKRASQQLDDRLHHAEGKVFNDILEVVDNFERALNNTENQADFESFKKGMQMIFEQMKKFLEIQNVSQIESVGQRFDPDLHEAVMRIETDEYPEGVVATEVAGGYKKGERVIRHAKVGVSTGKPKDSK